MKKDKVAFVDLDGTLIVTSSGNSFPWNKNDWEIIDKTVIYLKRLISEGYRLVLVTNQSSLARSRMTPIDFQYKVDSIQEKIGFDFDEMYVALKRSSEYRKPKFKELVKDLIKKGIMYDKSTSIMIGDAGGREGDWSNSDKLFADNLGVRFVHVDDIK